MKLKKILAGVSAAALAASMSCAFSASALTLDAGSVDFEDGDFSFVYVNTDGGDKSVLSVEDYDGSKQLKVDVQDCTQVPKIWFDMDKIMPREKSVTVKQIEFDLTLVPKNAEEQVGWAGGAVGTAGGFDVSLPGSGQKNPGWSQGDWSCEDEAAYTPGSAAKVHVVRKMLLPTQMWSDKGVNPFFGLMRWGAETNYVMYIDNIVFSGDKGTITVGLPAVEETTVEETAAETEAAPAETEAAPAETEAAPAETEAAPAETEAAPAETEAAPAETTAAPVVETIAAETTAAPANTTTVPATGNTAAATIVAVMAVAGAAAVITKKRG